MGLMRPRRTRTAGTIAALAAATSIALLAGPQAGTAHAGDCDKVNKEARDLTLKQARQTVRCIVNNRRNAAGRGDLSSRDSLERAAQRHTRTMTSQNCFAHQCPGEGSLLTRLLSVGYLGRGLSLWGYAENIAWGGGGRSTPRSIVSAWMNSPPHRANILGRFQHIGVGFRDAAPTGGDAGAGTYTIDLGYRG
jgi:uncharacterized protein YkwD